MVDSPGGGAETRLLAWFLGPKAENGELLEEVILQVLRDYLHWRRNYFPEDPAVVTRQISPDLRENLDVFSEKITGVIAELRRNFPFYSPRYLAHMLSDVTLPSIAGYFAGMLYNPNNVTPEAAPVTVNWEIFASSAILSMLGFDPPPPPPTERSEEFYKSIVRKEFGWGHITSGGTLANIEALYIARTVRYFPLAVRDAATLYHLDISIKRPDGKAQDIRDFQDLDLLRIRPNESVFLLPRYSDAVRRRFDIPADQVDLIDSKAWGLLRESKRGLDKGLGHVLDSFPPAIFVSGTSHYSVGKAVDVLGLGKAHLVRIPTDERFRMNLEELESAVERELDRGRTPVAVVGTVGTTEEGAVDPIQGISDLRAKMEKKNRSFWLHIDAAWGGFLRSVFATDSRVDSASILTRTAETFGFEPGHSVSEWHQRFQEWLTHGLPIDDFLAQSTLPLVEEYRQLSLKSSLQELHAIAFDANDPAAYLTRLKELLSSHGDPRFSRVEKGFFKLRMDDRIRAAREFVSTNVTLSKGRYHRTVRVEWGADDVCKALMAFDRADSITVDPHKMGYVPYPCGFVAFRNDRVRHLILEKSPYITSSHQNTLLYRPPRYSVPRPHPGFDEAANRVNIDAFGPFILEGSKPGAAASGLWASIQTIPLTQAYHGSIMRASLLAARELHEWIVHWDRVLTHNEMDHDFVVIPLTGEPPDTNVVTFVVKKKSSRSLSVLNNITSRVYESFTIQAELGERQYSYLQSFFVSKTRFTSPAYPFETLDRLFRRWDMAVSKAQYDDEGLVVLRSAVMNPYIHVLRSVIGSNILKEFMEKLSDASSRAIVAQQLEAARSKSKG